MNAAENNLVQLLTGQPSLYAATITQLKDITERYPYFSIGQLLLAKKCKLEGEAYFLQQYQHCALYFSNTQWLQYQLHNTESSVLPEVQEIKVEQSANPAALLDSTKALSLQNNNQTSKEDLTVLPANEAAAGFSLQMGDVKDEPEMPPLDEEEIEGADTLPPEASAKIADLLQHQVQDFNAPLSEKPDLPLSSEPYHTIDYFASQGIKIDAQQPLDALAKKVHTFTDWLKQMKRINQYPTDLGSDPDTESFVQSIANTSNQPREVYTEAMAEVWIMQGKTDKAIELYQKLSLLNPGKTAYFAAKIHHLKAL